MLPVERIHPNRVAGSLAARGHEIQLPRLVEVPGEGRRIAQQICLADIPILLGFRPGRHRLGREIDDKINHTLRCGQIFVDQKWPKISMQPRRLQIPVHHQHALAVTCQDPRDVGEGHRTTRSTLVRVERYDFARSSRLDHASLPPDVDKIGWASTVIPLSKASCTKCAPSTGLVGSLSRKLMQIFVSVLVSLVFRSLAERIGSW